MSKTNKILVVIIALLVTALVIGSFFTVKKTDTLAGQADSLKIENTGLLMQIAKRDSLLYILNKDTANLSFTIDSLNNVFFDKELYIRKLKKQRDEALAQLEGITSDSTYQFLQQVAYNFPGELKFKFNDNQIKEIHQDYEVSRNAEKLIPAMSDEIEVCKTEISHFTALTGNLKKTVDLQSANIVDYKGVIANDSTIMDAQRRVIVKEVRRKNFWKITTGVTVLVATILLI
jgi:predicted  nucleic acid-binding Zn-ribbon protein